MGEILDVPPGVLGATSGFLPNAGLAWPLFIPVEKKRQTDRQRDRPEDKFGKAASNTCGCLVSNTYKI